MAFSAGQRLAHAREMTLTDAHKALVYRMTVVGITNADRSDVASLLIRAGNEFKKSNADLGNSYLIAASLILLLGSQGVVTWKHIVAEAIKSSKHSEARLHAR